MHVLIRGRGRCPDGKCPYDGRCHLAAMDLKGLMHINERSHVALRQHPASFWVGAPSLGNPGSGAADSKLHYLHIQGQIQDFRRRWCQLSRNRAPTHTFFKFSQNCMKLGKNWAMGVGGGGGAGNAFLDPKMIY